MRAAFARAIRSIPMGKRRYEASSACSELAGGLLLAIASLCVQAADTAVLGTPAKGSTVSGVGVISGYHCTSKDIEVRIDGQSVGMAGAGTTLLGTLGVCGRTDTGFSLLYNFNNLPEGSHVVSVYADGVQFGANTIYTVRSGGVPWLSGVSEKHTVLDFPYAGDVATLEWNQSMQNFLVTGTEVIGNSGADVSSLAGSYRVSSVTTSISGGTCSGFDSFNNVAVNVVVRDKIALVSVWDCTFALGNAVGDKSRGFDMTGTVRCDYRNGPVFRAQVSSSRLRYSSTFDELHGDLIVDLGGDQASNCLQTIHFW